MNYKKIYIHQNKAYPWALPDNIPWWLLAKAQRSAVGWEEWIHKQFPCIETFLLDFVIILAFPRFCVLKHSGRSFKMFRLLKQDNLELHVYRFKCVIVYNCAFTLKPYIFLHHLKLCIHSTSLNIAYYLTTFIK